VQFETTSLPLLFNLPALLPGPAVHPKTRANYTGIQLAPNVPIRKVFDNTVRLWLRTELYHHRQQRDDLQTSSA